VKRGPRAGSALQPREAEEPLARVAELGQQVDVMAPGHRLDHVSHSLCELWLTGGRKCLGAPDALGAALGFSHKLCEKEIKMAGAPRRRTAGCSAMGNAHGVPLKSAGRLARQRLALIFDLRVKEAQRSS
jgi:hypothetical protein